MIRADIPTAIVLYLIGSLTLILVAWIVHEWRHRHKSLEIEKKTALQCSICLFSFITSTEHASAQCPRCHSWVTLSRISP